ncbi:hypothetical protein ZIOFF_001085 [Zingiber officinale]|uniref:PB1 domain-containing protein n=1 Tax=Zingiber officinale TaxID=94328 RepID=A0A8J5HUX7_ZINOF|nr:hypothetical protein ZIOFF_001085 [Zingiber officinale]
MCESYSRNKYENGEQTVTWAGVLLNETTYQSTRARSIEARVAVFRFQPHPLHLQPHQSLSEKKIPGLAAMVGASTSSSTSSCAFFGSFVEGVGPSAASKPSAASSASSVSRLKFVCSYGGRILPRYTDGKLRYFGGDTRVFAVDRSAAFSELQEKMRDFCGWTAVGVRCQLPTEDLDALVSIKSDEDLFNLVELYDLAGRQKIRAFLFPLASKPSSPPSAATSGGDRSTLVTSDRYVQIPRPATLVGRLLNGEGNPRDLIGTGKSNAPNATNSAFTPNFNEKGFG